GLTVLTAAGPLGADAVRSAGLTPEVVYSPASGDRADAGGTLARAPEFARMPETEAADTTRAVAALAAAGCELILVVGGDGTLRDAAAGLGADGATAADGLP
ncbi:NAD(+)/NADH kinase, partial [Mycobacterium tuberculosis]|uniref:NAD(+)/NADH kinase n=1 Tax=Mycobacterium tuberculosis TaxID=1773 RepID=UPI000AC4A7E2